MKVKTLYGIILLSLGSFLGYGQQELQVAAKMHYGFVIPHRPIVRNLIQGHSQGLELNFYKITDASKPWHVYERFPFIGLDVFISNLGNNRELGNQVSTMAYLDFPLGYKRQHRFKTGVGLGYTSKIWDLDNNVKGLLLSAHFNAAIVLQYSFRMPVSDKIDIMSGLRITHFSNGGLKLPNLGTNNATAFVGINFGNETASQKLPTSKKFRTDEYAASNWIFTSSLAVGLKQMSLADKKKYMAYSFTNMVDKRISQKTSWGVGIDVFYNSGIEKVLSDENPSTSMIDALQVGAFISYTKHLHPWEIKIMMGSYLKNKYQVVGPIYNRVGLRYFINEHFFTGVFLKTHYFTADHGELGVGWRF